ncbi:MAG: ABC transporter ATP-binding protein [Thaumarchaeota archaeon]|nr:ABC transporter ATP-binding protein [Nitrososphaerota archaeon]
MTMEPNIEIENLNVSYISRNTRVRAVREFSLDLRENESVGLLGESGAGKSTVGWALLGLIGKQNVVTGEINFQGKNILKMTNRELNAYRWTDASMIFQASLNTLDPLITVGQNFVDLLTNKKTCDNKRDARALAWETMKLLALQESIMDAYPHQLSGGMKQRVAIAMAISTNPKVLVADEPTTALDTITQASILRLMKTLREQKKIRGILFVSHDVTVHAYMTDRLLVMYRGRVIEQGSTKEVITNPLHPYTKLLLSSERIGGQKEGVRAGASQDDVAPADGCPYVPFCPYAMKSCSESFPTARTIGQDHRVSCFLYDAK